MSHTEQIASELAKAQALVAQAEKSAAIKEKILKALPDGFVPRFIFAGGYKCDASIKFQNKTRADLPAFYAAFPAVAAVLVKGACTSFMPLERLADSEADKAVHIAPYVFDLKTWGERAEYTNATVSWWTKLDGLLVKVCIELKHDVARHEKIESRDGRGKLIGRKWVATGLPVGNRIQWWTEANMPKDVTVYWFNSESETISDVIN